MNISVHTIERETMKTNFISEEVKNRLHENLGAFGTFLDYVILYSGITLSIVSYACLIAGIGVPVWTMLVPFLLFPFLKDFAIYFEPIAYIWGLVIVLNGSIETRSVIWFWIFFALWVIRFLFVLICTISFLRYTKNGS